MRSGSAILVVVVVVFVAADHNSSRKKPTYQVALKSRISKPKFWPSLNCSTDNQSPTKLTEPLVEPYISSFFFFGKEDF